MPSVQPVRAGGRRGQRRRHHGPAHPRRLPNAPPQALRRREGSIKGFSALFRADVLESPGEQVLDAALRQVPLAGLPDPPAALRPRLRRDQEGTRPGTRFQQ
eukprot:TRINITY_DN109127_c0_g1_i1.p3 TRINITY_DN109127_c0_g1~~TRINITY_DN109127_c0_g1_i1.p3  ORF type:complete len:102 (-),score=9.04 TRINITY_DN109127_c0_g1_i1:661-966(-)